MDRRNFLTSSARLMLVTSGLFVTGKFLTACHHDDDNNFGGYYNGYYNGYYDDRNSGNDQNQNQDQNQAQEPRK